MRKISAAVVVGVLLASSLGASPQRSQAAPDAKLASDVVVALEDLEAGQMITVIATMREGDRPVARRVGAVGGVVRALRASANSSQDDVRAYLRAGRAGGSVARFTPLWVIDAVSVTATADVVHALAARPDVVAITPDAVEITPSAAPVEPNIDAVHAPDLWAGGNSGEGVVIATLDSGVDTSHPDLASSWRGGSSDWFDPYGQHATPTDMSGHGTATLGVVLGGENGGTSIGMAPGARWIAARVFNDAGTASATAVHQAFQWVLDPDGDPTTDDAPSVVNGSWSIGTGPGCDLSFQPDVQALRAAGILPVFAAGNFGPGTSSSVSPANYPEAFAVGAVDDDGTPYAGSGRGPSTCGGRSRVFPDLVAPGVGIRTTDRYGQFQTLTGTSVAAPHATGAAALLLSAHPGMTPDQLTAALVGAAADLGVAGLDEVTGAGLLDVVGAEDALTAPLFADGFESGSFAAWSAAITNGGRLQVRTDAALEGVYGMRATIVNRSGMFVTDRTPAAERGYRARFSFDPGSVLIPAGSSHDLFVGVQGSSTAVFRIKLRSASSGYQIRASARRDQGGFAVTPWASLSNGPHVLELGWSSGSGTGAVELSIDGLPAGSLSGLANGTTALDLIRLGPQTVGRAISGIERFDAFVSSEGGPLP